MGRIKNAGIPRPIAKSKKFEPIISPTARAGVFNHVALKSTKNSGSPVEIDMKKKPMIRVEIPDK
jgi:hypothetical protein